VGWTKVRHPEIHSVADVGGLLGGRIGREVVGVIFLLYMVCSVGGEVLGISIALNAITNHATCTMVFTAVATIASLLLSTIQTLDKVSFVAWAGIVSIFVVRPRGVVSRRLTHASSPFSWQPLLLAFRTGRPMLRQPVHGIKTCTCLATRPSPKALPQCPPFSLRALLAL
jgi:hypothetical protein